MNYRSDIERCLDFIEINIKEELDIALVAKSMGYSLYHFCRAFSFCTGVPIMEYIRRRRLSLAAVELYQGRKVIDISTDYCFETQSGFTKAFRKEYGFSPTQYIARMAGFETAKDSMNIGGYVMNCKIVKKPAFKVAGYGIETNVVNSAFTKDVASFWDQYEGEGMETRLYKILQPTKHGELGLCVPTSTEGNVKYLLGVIVENFNKVTEDMLTVEIPEAEYAVFTTPPVNGTTDAGLLEFPKVIKSTWKYIFEEWFVDSGYEYDESKLDFEYYDERCHSRLDNVMDIYVPVKRKENETFS
jgi:AraC family transcriptional regulator